MKEEIHIYQLDAPIRIDKYLTNKFSTKSRTYIKNCLLDGSIRVNHEIVRPSYKLNKGDTISVLWPPVGKTTDDLEPVNIPLDILYEDNDIVCINKPAGLVVHPGAGNKTNTLANGLKYHFNQLSDINGNIRPGIVHRLDKNTSGVIIVAKTNEAHFQLGKQFQNRTIKKRYKAVTWGEWKNKTGILKGSIARRKSDPTIYGVFENGRAAETQYNVDFQNRYFSILSFKPKTGRTHQIRVHSENENHPIICDIPYGGGISKAKGFIPEVSKLMTLMLKKMGRHALHAEKIEFEHPINKNPIIITAPYPSDIVNLMDAVRDFDAQLI